MDDDDEIVMKIHLDKPRRVVQCTKCRKSYIEHWGEIIASSPCCDAALRLMPGDNCKYEKCTIKLTGQMTFATY